MQISPFLIKAGGCPAGHPPAFIRNFAFVTDFLRGRGGEWWRFCGSEVVIFAVALSFLWRVSANLEKEIAIGALLHAPAEAIFRDFSEVGLQKMRC